VTRGRPGRSPAGRGRGGKPGEDDVDLPAQVTPVLLGGCHGHRHAVQGGGGDEEAEQVAHPAARGLVITALAAVGLLAAGAALTLLLPPARGAGGPPEGS
jgi:hypothetical protein